MAKSRRLGIGHHHAHPHSYHDYLTPPGMKTMTSQCLDAIKTVRKSGACWPPARVAMAPKQRARQQNRVARLSTRSPKQCEAGLETCMHQCEQQKSKVVGIRYLQSPQVLAAICLLDLHCQTCNRAAPAEIHILSALAHQAFRRLAGASRTIAQCNI